MAKKFDPIDLLQKVLENDFDLTVFRQIDETPFPEAPHFLDFITDKEFCNATILPWQVEAGMHLFSEYCPKCSNPKYLTDLFDEPIEEIRDNVQFLQHGKCPKCHQTKLDLFTIGEPHPSKPSLKSEFVGCLGQRSGKCFTASTEVLTPRGAVEIQHLKPGDTVYGYEPDGSIKPCRVVAKVDQGEQEVWDLYRYGQKVVSVTPNHKFLCRNEDQKNRKGIRASFPEYVRTVEEILDKKSNSFRRALVDIPGGVVHEPHAYAIGALAGDGCSRQGTKNCIWISSAVREIPRKVAELLGGMEERNSQNNYTWGIYGAKHSRDASVSLTCNHYENWLQDRYAHEKILDLETIKTWDKESRLQLLAGLLDTDGSVYFAKNKYGEETSIVLNFSSQSKSLVDAINWILLSHFQVELSVDTDNREKYVNGPCYSAKLKDCFHVPRILKALAPYMVHPEKKWNSEWENKLKIRNSHPDYTKLTCKEKRVEKTFDIQIDNKTSLFVLARQGLITHNSKIVAMASAYQLHRWVKIPEPTEYYGLPRMELIMGSFAAMDAGQAEENLWIPFKNLYDFAPWFRKYNEFLRGEQKRLSIPLVEVRDTYIAYVHKNLLLDFSGADDRKKRGRTRLWGAIDEIAFFNTDKKINNKILDADKNYTALNNSLATVRKKAIMRMKKHGDYNVLMPIMYNSSSPKNVQDKIWRLTKGASQNAWCYAVHRATWEANPDYTIEDCRNINQGLTEVQFWTDFGAIPPYSDSPYIGDSRQILKLCDVEPKPPIMTAKRDLFIDQMGDRYLTLKAKIEKPDKMTPRLLSIDNGYSNNSFAATIFRFEAFGKKPVLDFAVNLYPEPDSRLFINFQAMFENFILPVIQNFRILNVFYDRWQSLDQIHRLRNMKVDAQSHSLSFEKDFLPFKQTLLSGNFGLPYCGVNMDHIKDQADPLEALKDDPIAILIWQCLTVREVGKKVLKPLDGDDDLFRAFVLGGSRFSDEKIRKKYETYQGVMNKDGPVLGRTYSLGQPAATTLGGNKTSPFMSTRTFGRRK